MDYEKRKKKYIIAAAVIVGLALLGIIIWLIVKYTRKDKNGGGSNDDDPCNDHPCLPTQDCHPTPGYKPGYKCSPTAHPDPCGGINCNNPYGDCVKGECVCTDGWTGTECKTPPKPGANRYSCTGKNGTCEHTTATGTGTYLTSNCGGRCSSQSRRYFCEVKGQRCSPTAATGTSTYETMNKCNQHCQIDPTPKGDGPLFGYWYTQYCDRSATICPNKAANADHKELIQWGCVDTHPPHATNDQPPEKLVKLDDLLGIINKKHNTHYEENTYANLGIGTPNTMQTVLKGPGTWGQAWTNNDRIQDEKDVPQPGSCTEKPPKQCGYHVYEYGANTLCGISPSAGGGPNNPTHPNNIMNIGGWGALYNANEQNTPIAWSDASIPDPAHPKVILDALSDGGYNGISFDIEGILPSAKDAMIKKLNALLPKLRGASLASGKTVDYVWIVIPGNNVSPDFGGPLPFGTSDQDAKGNPTVNISNITHVQLMFYGAGNDSIYGGDFGSCYQTPTVAKGNRPDPNSDCTPPKYGTPSASFGNELKTHPDRDWLNVIKDLKSMGFDKNQIISAWSWYNTPEDKSDMEAIIKDVWEVAQGGLFVWCKGQDPTFGWGDGGWAQCCGSAGCGGGGGGGGGTCSSGWLCPDGESCGDCWRPNNNVVKEGNNWCCEPKSSAYLSRGGPGMGRTM